MSVVGFAGVWVSTVGLLMGFPAATVASEQHEVETTAFVNAQFREAKRTTGVLQIKVQGLPQGARAKVKVVGGGSRKSVVGSKNLKRVKPGKYSMKVGRVTFGGFAYTGHAKPKSVRVRPGRRARVSVTYVRETFPTPTPMPTPTSPPTPPVALRFDFSNAVGVAVPEASFRSGSAVGRAYAAAEGSQLLAVLPDGTTKNAVAAGSLGTVSEAQIGPDKRIYLAVLSPPVQGSDKRCFLLRVDPGDGSSLCLDDKTPVRPKRSSMAVNPALQFDAQGAVYYLGSSEGGPGVQLIRNLDANKTNLVNDNIQINEWFVYPDGSVFVAGMTNSTMATWFRRITPTGGIQTLAAGATVSSIGLFPDGNVYFGQWGNDQFGVRRVLTSSMTMDSKMWIGGNTNGQDTPRFFDASALCSEIQPGMQGFCGMYGTSVRGFYRYGDEVFAVPVWQGGSLLLKYYPELKVTNTTTRATLGESLPDGIALAGQTSDGYNVITRYDPASDTEQVLVGKALNVEAYHLTYAAESNSLMFDGLRFSDGKYVIGQVDLGTGDVAVVPASKMATFQTFR